MNTNFEVIRRTSIDSVSDSDINKVVSGSATLILDIPCLTQGHYKNLGISPFIIKPNSSKSLLQQSLDEATRLTQLNQNCIKCPNYSDKGQYVSTPMSMAVFDPEINKCACKPGIMGKYCDKSEELYTKLAEDSQISKRQSTINDLMLVTGTIAGTLAVIGAIIYYKK